MLNIEQFQFTQREIIQGMILFHSDRKHEGNGCFSRAGGVTELSLSLPHGASALTVQEILL